MKRLQMITDGNVDQGMIVFMMTLSYLIPICGVLCMLWKAKALKVINAVLAWSSIKYVRED